MPETVEDIIAHYGVPGMKWGRRKSSNGGSSGPSSAVQDSPPKVGRGLLGRKVKVRVAKENSPDAVEFKALKLKAKTKGIDSLSNTEVRAVTNRFNLEKNYRDAFPRQRNPIVEVAIKGILIKTGKKSILEAAISEAPRLAILAQSMKTKGKHQKP